MKMLKFLIGCILIILSGFESLFSPYFLISDIDMSISSSVIIFHEDTHGGFHGDGEEIIIFRPTAEQIQKIEAEWQKTPVEFGIASLIFSENEYNGLELTKYIPKTEGFWFYKNRNSEAVYSLNFSFAFFDGEKVYYYELDT